MKYLVLMLSIVFILLPVNSPGQGDEATADDFATRLAAAEKLIDGAALLKDQKDRMWKTKLREAYNAGLALYRENPRSAEVYLILAKCYWYNNRPAKARRSLKKAIYYNPSYVKALIFEGDTYSEEGDMRAKRAYEAVLKVSGLDKETESLIYLKLGDLYGNRGDMKQAKVYWDKAVSTASDSPAAGLARKRSLR